MRMSPLLMLFHCCALLMSLLLAGAFLLYPVEIGRLAIELRAFVAVVATVLFLLAVRPLLAVFAHRLLIYLVLVCLPGAALAAWYFLAFLPGISRGGLEGEQLAGALLTDSTVNGLVVVGFSYPIFTPTLSLSSSELYTTEVDVYLRILDGNNEAALFRAVRQTLPDARLSVEATVHGMLSENSGVMFLPIAIPPGGSVEGRVIFIISDLNDGTTFDEALGRSYPATFEIRDPDSGELLLSFPLTRVS